MVQWHQIEMDDGRSWCRQSARHPRKLWSHLSHVQTSSRRWFLEGKICHLSSARDQSSSVCSEPLELHWHPSERHFRSIQHLKVSQETPRCCSTFGVRNFWMLNWETILQFFQNRSDSIVVWQSRVSWETCVGMVWSLAEGNGYRNNERWWC